MSPETIHSNCFLFSNLEKWKGLLYCLDFVIFYRRSAYLFNFALRRQMRIRHCILFHLYNCLPMSAVIWPVNSALFWFHNSGHHWQPSCKSNQWMERIFFSRHPQFAFTSFGDCYRQVKKGVIVESLKMTCFEKLKKKQNNTKHPKINFGCLGSHNTK